MHGDLEKKKMKAEEDNRGSMLIENKQSRKGSQAKAKSKPKSKPKSNKSDKIKKELHSRDIKPKSKKVSDEQRERSSIPINGSS